LVNSKWGMIRYDTIQEFSVSSKAECDQLNLAHETKTNNASASWYRCERFTFISCTPCPEKTPPPLNKMLQNAQYITQSNDNNGYHSLFIKLF